MPSLIIAGTPAGGAGKSSLALAVAEAIAAHHANLVVLDADIAGENGKKVRLDAALAGRPGVSVGMIGTGPTDDELRADKNAAVRHWAKIREIAKAVDVTLLDLGANVLQKLGDHMSTAADLYDEDGIAITLLVPVTARGGCLRKAIEGVRIWADAVPTAAVVIVQNLIAGPVKHLAEYAELLALVPGATQMELPTCLSHGTEAWSRLEAVPLSPWQAVDMKTKDLAAALNSRPGQPPLLDEEVLALKADIKKWRRAMTAAGFDSLIDGILMGNALSPAV